MNFIFELAAMIVCIVLSAYFSSSEMALFSLSRARVLSFESSKERSERNIFLLMKDYHKTLIAIILGNMFVNSCISMFNDELVGKLNLGAAGTFIISGVIGVVVLLVFGEISPMTIAYIHSESWSRKVATPIFYFRKFLTPVINAVSVLCDKVLDLLGRAEPMPLSHDEYLSYIDSGIERDIFTKDEAFLLKEVFSLRETSLEDVMIPRTDLVHITYDMSPETVAAKIRSSRQVFMPLSKDTLDNADAILESKLFFALNENERTTFATSNAVSKAVFLPDGSTLEKALRTMRDKKINAAFAADEYGSLNGIVTLHDIYSEVAGGSIERGLKNRVKHMKAGPDVWIFDGMSTLDFVRENSPWIDCNLDEHYKSNTISGLFCEESGSIPKPGDKITIDGMELKALSVSKNCISKVRIKNLRGNTSAFTQEEDDK